MRGFLKTILSPRMGLENLPCIIFLPYYHPYGTIKVQSSESLVEERKRENQKQHSCDSMVVP